LTASACLVKFAGFSVRPTDPTRPIATPSGGNQQKVVVARWMEADVRLQILEEPTIGVDIGWYTGGQQVVASLPESFANVARE
jgi:ABC-type sugar transport system ATPase subunit